MSSGAYDFHQRGGSSAAHPRSRAARVRPGPSLLHRRGAYQDGSYQDMSRPPTIGDRRTAAPFATRLSKLFSTSCSLFLSSGARSPTRTYEHLAQRLGKKTQPQGRIARGLRRPPRRRRIEQSGSVTASNLAASGRCRAGSRRRASGEEKSPQSCLAMTERNARHRTLTEGVHKAFDQGSQLGRWQGLAHSRAACARTR